MKLNRRLLVISVPILLGLSSAAAWAQMGPGGLGGPGGSDEVFPGGRFEEMRDRWIDELELTDDQVTQLEAIREEAYTDTADLREQLRQAHATMQELMAADTSADQLRQQHDQIQSLHQELGDRMFETRLAMRQVLTPDQRSRVAELMPAGHHGGRGFHRGDRGFGQGPL